MAVLLLIRAAAATAPGAAIGTAAEVVVGGGSCGRGRILHCQTGRTVKSRGTGRRKLLQLRQFVKASPSSSPVPNAPELSAFLSGSRNQQKQQQKLGRGSHYLHTQRRSISNSSASASCSTTKSCLSKISSCSSTVGNFAACGCKFQPFNSMSATARQPANILSFASAAARKAISRSPSKCGLSNAASASAPTATSSCPSEVSNSASASPPCPPEILNSSSSLSFSNPLSPTISDCTSTEKAGMAREEDVDSLAGLQSSRKRNEKRPSDARLLLQAFAELQLKPIQETVGGVRVRQHVNPLKASLMAPLPPPDWGALFTDSHLPIMVDVGCGAGRLLMTLAHRSRSRNSTSSSSSSSRTSKHNYLGLDVRERLVDRANEWAKELDLASSVRFFTANATMAFDSLLATYPGPLAFVSILCPDPHFKRRHQKRKIVQRRLVEAIVRRLETGGGILVQSDVEDVAWDMRTQFEEYLGTSLEVPAAPAVREEEEEKEEQPGGVPRLDSEGWVQGSPLEVHSEREAQVLAAGGRVYRALYRRL